MCPYRLGIIRPSKQPSASMNYRVEMHDVEYKTIREIYEVKLVGKGEDFEKVIADICSWLSMKERVNAKINTKVQILGDDGTTHEIDVLYTFEHFGISYQVGIECKN